MSKQDRQGARTPANLEQKYNFGNVFSKLDAADKQQSLTMRQFAELITETIATIQKDIKGLNTSVETLTKSTKTLAEKDTEIEKAMEKSDNLIQNKISAYWETIYPVGSIYVSVSDTSPAKLFGGSWDRIKDRFLLASGNSYSAGSTGGESKHKLTVDELPSHRHGWATQETNPTYAVSWPSWEWRASSVQQENTPNSVAGHTNYVGGSQAHNNMPPYLAVYVWKRTA